MHYSPRRVLSRVEEKVGAYQQLWANFSVRLKAPAAIDSETLEDR